MCEADAVIPSLDAGTATLYRQINRPHPEVTFERFLEGLVTFRQEYWGKLWPEVMLVRGLNDTEQALQDIAAALDRIRPDAVTINLPTRPPAETWVEPPDSGALMRAEAILGDVAEIVHPAEGNFDLSGPDNLLEAVVGIITRHPMRQEELERALAEWAPGEVREALAQLEASREAQVIERYGTCFWTASGSCFPREAQSQATAPGQRGTR